VPGVHVVIAKDGEYRHADVAAGIRDHPRLFRLTCRREIAGKQNDVALRGDVLERALDAGARRLRRV
jgi:hypothetical protein